MSRRLLVAGLGAALALSGLTTSPAVAATWPSPVVVAPAAPTFYYRYDPQTVVLPDGTALAAWYTYDGANAHVDDGLWVAEHPVGGGWGTPTKIVSGGMNGAKVAVGPDGTVAAAFTTIVASKLVLNAVVRPAGGSWGGPVVLSDTTKTASSPQVAVGAGQITAVWVQDSGPLAQPVARSRPLGAAGTWGSPITFTDTGVSGTDVAASAAGTLVTWLLSSDTSPSAYYPASTVRSSFRATTVWEPPVSVSGTGRRVAVAEPAAGADGTLAVTWESRLPGIDGYYTSARTLAAIRPPGASWGGESLLSDPDIEGRYPHLGVGPDGTTTVVWESYDGANNQVATRVSQGGSWQPQQVLTESVDSESGPQLAMGADGTAVVTFRNLEKGTGVAIRPPGSAWRPTDFLATADQTGYERSVAVGGSTVAVLWTYGYDSALMAVVADHLLPLPPVPPLAQPTAETGPITGPAKIEKGKKASYSFTGTPASVTFQCRVDKTRHQQTGATGATGKKPVPWRGCHSPVKVKTKTLKLGPHTLYVRAVLAGVPDSTPSKKKIKVQSSAG